MSKPILLIYKSTGCPYCIMLSNLWESIRPQLTADVEIYQAEQGGVVIERDKNFRLPVDLSKIPGVPYFVLVDAAQWKTALENPMQPGLITNFAPLVIRKFTAEDINAAIQTGLLKMNTGGVKITENLSKVTIPGISERFLVKKKDLRQLSGKSSSSSISK